MKLPNPITTEGLLDLLAQLPKRTFNLVNGDSVIRAGGEYAGRCPICVLVDEILGEETGYTWEATSALELALGRELDVAEQNAMAHLTVAADSRHAEYRARLVEAVL